MKRIFNDFDKWCDRQEENNNWWFMFPATCLFFGTLFCFLMLIGIVLGLI